MPSIVDAIIDEHGTVQLLSPMRLPSPRRATVTIHDESPDTPSAGVSATGSEPEAWTRHYEPVRVIGQGGMSVVHLARDRSTGMLVCVKELQPQVASSTLEQECRALSRVRHAGILRLINFEVRGARPFLVLEYGLGLPLTRYLAKQVLIQPPLAIALTAEIFDAIAAAHDCSVFHRDLKPDNILVSAAGDVLKPKVLDFGLAIVDDRDDRNALTGAGVIAGTIQFMAPEQMSGDAVTAACDVYAVGQMAWEMIAGTKAFPSFPQVCRAKLERDGLIVQAAPFPTSRSMVDAIYHCTRLAPGDRLTAESAARTFRDLLPHLPPQSNLVPANLDFHGRPGDRPTGWFDGLGYVDDVSMSYVSRIVSDNGRTFASLERHGAADGEFGALMQRVPATHLAGMVVRVEASVRTDDVRTWAGLWIRADGRDRQLAFKNMYDQPLRGTSGWSAVSIELTLPAPTEWLNFGAMLAGDGALCLANVRMLARTRDDVWRPLGLPPDMTEDQTEEIISPDQLT